jgi:DNA-binding NarL/FixJ family response regulator
MLKIILADNQAIFRAGAAKVLAVEDEVRVMAQANTSEQMMMALEKFRPHVAIFAAALQPDLKLVIAEAQKFKTRLVVVAENGEQAARYLGAGVHGLIYRNVGGTALVECIRKIARGETWVQDMHAPADAATENDFVGARVRDRLTPKELRIVALIVQGFKNKEIAKQLGTTEQVIKNYLRNVYDKIGVSDRLELALFTVHHRILAEAAAATAAAASGAVRVPAAEAARPASS